LLAAMVILVFAFGSLMAAGLPIATALLGLAVGISSILLLAAFTDVGTAAPELGAMIGLGVGIDYSLFIVTRHRENLAAGMEMEASIGHAVATAGQAVLFAGTTVVIAICGLLVAGIPYVAVLGFTAAMVVAVMMLAALTLLPALLGLVGPRIDKGHVRGLGRRRHGSDPTEGGAEKTPFWERWATHVARHPWPFAIAGILLSFLLLMLVFHSIAIPATAAIMNLLSVGAAYGVTVAVFQWGWGKGLLGLTSTVPIISFVPMMMFAILFGLSMDYQVFLLTRVREEYNKSGDTRTAVVQGVARTARVITSAALIMIAVFLSFAASPIPEIKMFGLGLAVAVAVDATVVRMMLVPAIMQILGKANWWFPAWLDRILPKITIE